MPAEKPLTEDRLKAAHTLWPQPGGGESGWLPLSVREWVAGRGQPMMQEDALTELAEAFMCLRTRGTPDPRDARIADLERQLAETVEHTLAVDAENERLKAEPAAKTRDAALDRLVRQDKDIDELRKHVERQTKIIGTVSEEKRALEKQVEVTTAERETARDFVAEALRENRRLEDVVKHWKDARESDLMAQIERFRIGFMPEPGTFAPLDSVPPGAADFLALMFIANIRATGAANYVEHSFVTREEDNDVGRIIVTVQKVSGKTPNALRREAEKQRDALAAGLSEALESLADMSGFVETAYYAEKYGIAETVARLRLLLPGDGK